MSDALAPPVEGDIRPVVGRTVSNRGVILAGIALAVVAGALFAALETRRGTITSPAISVPPDQSGRIAPPPALAIPPDWQDLRAREAMARPETAPPPPEVSRRPAPRAYDTPPRDMPARPVTEPGPVAPPDAGYIYQASPPLPRSGDGTGNGDADERAHARRLANPATTVPQGSVIQAVLETALDSNHPGFARAVVARDVSSFNGSRVLIPKGSKLFGEYQADINLGQNRALIRWHRLMRPDGSIIDVDSPTADPLGRAGVKGKVNSHFFARFGGAILQSALDLGVQLGARKATGNTVIVGLPNSSQTITGTQPQQIRPTLKVRQGTSVSVFVARDLDFTDVER